MHNLLVCSYLEAEHIDRIQAVSAELQVHYRPDLIPAPRYAADHTGSSFVRSAKQSREWYELMRGAEILFDFDYTDPERMVEHATSARWIQASSAGIGQFVKRYRLDRLDAVLTTAAGIHARPLAEFVVWSALAFAKNYPRARKQQRDHVWQRFHNDDLEGKTLAVIGLGSIGREVVALARAVGLRTIGSKRTIEGIDAEALGVERLFPMSDLRSILGEADYVCLVCPHTAETEGLMNRAAFDAMKQGSVLINIGRGALVREDALLHALQHGPMVGAVLDVAPQEPLPASHPLWDMENVILFPHSASTSKGENDRLVRLFTDNLGRYLEGRPLRNVFDFERMY